VDCHTHKHPILSSLRYEPCSITAAASAAASAAAIALNTISDAVNNVHVTQASFGYCGVMHCASCTLKHRSLRKAVCLLDFHNATQQQRSID
jgi:hypothetical protein